MSASSMNLDARQRAMLDEMGVKVWWPVAAAPVDVDVAVAPVAEPPAPHRVAAVEEAPYEAPRAAPTPVRAPIAVPAPSAPAPPAPPAARAHGAAVLVAPPHRLYATEGAAEGGWLVVADMPPEADGRHGEPLAGDAGRLLDNMLRALQLHAGDMPVHLMRTHRGVASGRDGSPQPFADAFLPQAQALAPRLIFAMGPLAAQTLLQSAEPLGKLRGRAARLDALGGTPVVVSYHPAYLLRNPADKARAWVDLCLAADALAAVR
ncbi:uracil-DNA glycosylase family protein [Variovorax arabinosiphilus]|uniref:uracil-DNA glycosylase family protein n=1 Tax=Variovorax arabinosiphilus TaxID=3053498 RepID=UPI0025783B62|nr:MULTISPECIES: uracil-DNA glycosylase family protein [unclassified Variovorax]MDM0121860.1 uracil-DNA glycosylase family protein [Variovorax sp. J2L1-78]MDM0131610.1 uracil-DNA glycosylase family protein [Variovorax sp. J2L1-63]MDM0234623.1 uracil-DNA glycosylase family protein [Variovorax sp. J2R1-6]